MEWLKSVWARWKVQVSVVGGVLVIATAYGTCSVEPPAAEEAPEVEAEVEAVESAAGNTEAEVENAENTETQTATETQPTTETPAETENTED